MAHYRIYRLNPDNSFARRIDVECDCDRDARDVARKMLNGTQQAEVWAGDTFLGVVSGIPLTNGASHIDDWLSGNFPQI